MTRGAGLALLGALVLPWGCGSAAGPAPPAPAGWQAPVVVEPAPPLATESEPRLALDPSGGAVAVWLQEQGLRAGERIVPGTVGLRASSFSPGSGWGPSVAVEAPGAGGAVCCPSLGSDAHGGSLVLSRRLGPGDRFLVWANRSDPPAGWQGGERIQTDPLSDGSDATLAVTPPGDAVAVWTQFDGRAGTVWASRFLPGSGWSPRQAEVSGVPPGNAYPPRVAAGAAGDVVVAWGDPSGVWANRLASGGEWLGARRIGSSGLFPAVAFDSAGRSLVAWGAPDGVWTNAYTPGQGWGDEARALGAPFPTVTGLGIDALGRAIVTFSSQDPVTLLFGAWAARFEPGSGWHDAVRLDRTGVATGDPALGVDPQGDAFAAWSDGGTLWASRYAVGGAWSPPLLLGAGLGHALGVDPLGNALLVWVGAPDGAVRSVRYQASTGP